MRHQLLERAEAGWMSMREPLKMSKNIPGPSRTAEAISNLDSRVHILGKRQAASTAHVLQS